MPKHRHHHHHSKSPSRRHYSPEGPPTGRAAEEPTRRGDASARHRHRSTPPRADIPRRRPDDVQPPNIESDSQQPYMIQTSSVHQLQMDPYRRYEGQYYAPPPNGELSTPIPVKKRNSGYVFATTDRRSTGGFDNPYVMRNRQGVYDAPAAGVDPRSHLLISGRPHRKYYIAKRDKGCLGPCNNACCYGAFDRPDGCCSMMNCCGCCDRERRVLKRVGSFSETDQLIRKRQAAGWCGGCCCY